MQGYVMQLGKREVFQYTDEYYNFSEVFEKVFSYQT